MIITAIYLLICWLSSTISVNMDIFMPLIIIEGMVDIANYVHKVLMKRIECKYS